MSRKVSDEARILTFYDTASLEKVTTVHNIVSARLKQRLAAESEGTANTPEQPKKRRRRRKQGELPLETPGVAHA